MATTASNFFWKLYFYVLIIEVGADLAEVASKLYSIEQILLNSLEVKTALKESILYPVEKDWMTDLQCYIKKNTRKYNDDLPCNWFPRPISVSSKGNNDYIIQSVWNTLVKSFGVSKDNDLSRIFVKDVSTGSVSYANDHILMKIDILRTNHDTKKAGKFPIVWLFPKNEYLGYIMTQLRHHYQVNRERKTRLWYMPDDAVVKYTSWLIFNLSQNACKVRQALTPFNLAKGISFSTYVDAVRKKFPNGINYNDDINRYSYRKPYYTEFDEERNCGGIFGTIILEVQESNGIWPTKQYPDILPFNSFTLPEHENTIIDYEGIDTYNEDFRNRHNVSVLLGQWSKKLMDKLDNELREEMLSIYDMAKMTGEKRCEKLNERENYMRELELGLRELQKQAVDLKNRLQDLRGYEEL